VASSWSFILQILQNITEVNNQLYPPNQLTFYILFPNSLKIRCVFSVMEGRPCTLPFIQKYVPMCPAASIKQRYKMRLVFIGVGVTWVITTGWVWAWGGGGKTDLGIRKSDASILCPVKHRLPIFVCLYTSQIIVSNKFIYFCIFPTST